MREKTINNVKGVKRVNMISKITDNKVTSNTTSQENQRMTLY